MDKLKPFLSDLGIINALGDGKDEIWKRFTENDAPLHPVCDSDWGEAPYYRIDTDYPPIPEYRYNNRLNRLLQHAYQEIHLSVEKAIVRYGKERIGVIIGSTDNGSEAALGSMAVRRSTGKFPEEYSLECQSAHAPAGFLKGLAGVEGPDMAISTACSSSSVALFCAKELIEGDICDAVIAGGADIVSQAVYLGFNALEAVAPQLCNPLSKNRNGITLGDGAAVFLVSRDDLGNEGIQIAGSGESADAYHMTAPDPEGKGAESSMRKALSDAGLDAADITYLNLHGTGTELNDSMESLAVSRVFPEGVDCSSTKPYTGHTLGAAGAMEAGICWLAMSSRNPEGKLPLHRWDGEADSELPDVRLVQNPVSRRTLAYMMSNSFAFGGNDASIILGRME